MTRIEYKVGDASQPDGPPGPKVIAHIGNDWGRWGAGFTGCLSYWWPHVEDMYRMWSKADYYYTFPEGSRPKGTHKGATEQAFELGEMQLVSAEPGLRVATMIAQHKTKPYVDQPLDYDALGQCLAELSSAVRSYSPEPTVHMPRIGCGLAGGRWRYIEPLIRKNLCKKDVAVVVYDLEKR